MKHLASILICFISLGFIAAATVMVIHGNWFLGFLAICAAVATGNNIFFIWNKHESLVTSEKTREERQTVGEGPQGSGPEV